MPKAIVVVSDTHCGSALGLLPPDVELSKGNTLNQNRVQTYLWECWLDFIDQVKRFDVAAVIHNGDAIEGIQPKQRGSELVATLPVDQCLLAEAAMTPLLKAAKSAPLYFIQGTEYHVGSEAREEEALARGLGAVRSNKGHAYTHEILNLDVGGVVLNTAHHISFAPVNRAMPSEKQIRASIAAYAAGYPWADVIVRSHVHHSVCVRSGYQLSITTGCFQFPTRYITKKDAYARPTIGATIIEIDPEAKTAGRLPAREIPILYDLPADKPMKVKIG